MQSLPPRTLVLCFDGTGNLYSATNTNVVKLFAMLEKDRREEQLVYYQAGIGTYSAPGMWVGFQLWLAKIADEAIAWYIDVHVMGGYQFLMQNYCAGDRICLFGFSRGAYTARALAGMLYKVGLLPKDNKEQVAFAYKIYKATGTQNDALAAGFKQAFCRSVQIEFIGCWDTVSSVGLFWGRHLPFTSGNTSIRRFRHALSLDEHRANFQPNLWHRDSPSAAGAALDPENASRAVTTVARDAAGQSGVAATDVCEVWFAGCHSDIGGGDLPSDVPHGLCDITLRWMVREVVAAQCGVQFDPAALAQLGLDADGAGDGSAAGADALDALEPLHDELQLRPLWWVLEVLPTFQSWQDAKGVWHRAFRWNLGRGRTIKTPKPLLHATVRTRMEDKNLEYVPRATWEGKPDATWET